MMEQIKLLKQNKTKKKLVANNQLKIVFTEKKYWEDIEKLFSGFRVKMHNVREVYFWNIQYNFSSNELVNNFDYKLVHFTI